MNDIAFLIIYLIAYFIFFFTGIFIHEGGHLIFGLLSGYQFGSYRVFSYVWSREDGKVILKKSQNKIAVGQCLMLPPKDEEKFNFVLYNLGGGILNIITAIILIFFDYFLNLNIFFHSIFLAGIVLNLCLCAINIIPMIIGIPNDGMNVYMALKSKEAKHGLYLMLHCNAELMEGKRFRDFDIEKLKLKDDADLKNYLVANNLIYEAAYYYDLGEFKKSIEIYNKLDISKIPLIYRNMVNLDLLNYYSIHNKNSEKSREIYNGKKMKKFLKMGIPSMTRVWAGYEFFIEDNKEKGRSLMEKAKKDIENFPNKGTRIMEKDYIAALEKMMNESA